jgi:hypothetical protein
VFSWMAGSSPAMTEKQNAPAPNALRATKLRKLLSGGLIARADSSERRSREAVTCADFKLHALGFGPKLATA